MYAHAFADKPAAVHNMSQTPRMPLHSATNTLGPDGLCQAERLKAAAGDAVKARERRQAAASGAERLALLAESNARKRALEKEAVRRAGRVGVSAGEGGRRRRWLQGAASELGRD